MAINKEFLTNLGVSAEIAEQIFAERGKEISETNNKIGELTTQLETANANIKALTSEKTELSKYAGDVEGYKAKIAEYELAAQKRAEKEASMRAEAEFNKKIEEVMAGKEFTSDYVKRGLMADIRTEYAKDATKGLSVIFDELTKDKDGIFKNPNNPAIVPPTNLPSGNTLSGVEKAFLARNPNIKLDV